MVAKYTVDAKLPLLRIRTTKVPSCHLTNNKHPLKKGAVPRRTPMRQRQLTIFLALKEPDVRYKLVFAKLKRLSLIHI